MFNKLIGNLPFNPSLMEQVSFYSKRLRQEQSIRRLGLMFVALTMLIQLFAVLVPPQQSLAYSSDYIINGLQTRDDILRAWDAPGSDLISVYGRFGLTRADVAALPLQPNSTIRSTDADYWTIGRSSLSGYSTVGAQFKAAEIPVNTGPSTVYLRQLHAWDIKNPSNTYRAFHGVKNGKDWWILVDCGNFTQIGKPPLNMPGLELHKTVNGGPRTLKPGDSFSFHFEYRNPVADSIPAETVIIEDTLDLAHFDVVSLPPYSAMSGSKLTITIPVSLVYSTTTRSAGDVVVKLKSAIPNGTSVCNAATARATNVFPVNGGGAPNTCVTVINPCPLDSSLSATDARCAAPQLVCTLTASNVNLTTKAATFKTTVTSSNPTLTHPVSYAYDFGDKTSRTNPSTALTDTATHTYVPGSYQVKVVVNYTAGNGAAATSKSVNCAALLEIKPDQPLGQSKTIKNLTQKLEGDAAFKTAAKPGDVLEYSLVTKNTFSYDRADYPVTDNIADLLDYADLDTAFLKTQGGTYDEAAHTINWSRTIPANSDDIRLFRITMKDPLPATNQPGKMTTNYDCIISNLYGNEIAVPVACPPAKQAEYVAAKLPNTGPGASLLIGFTATVAIAYFFARSRLMARELELVRTEYASGGGF